MPTISFYCAVCGEGLTVDESLAGGLHSCTRCERLVPIPGYTPAGEWGEVGLVYPPDILSMDIHFLCRACQTPLVVDARWEGHEVACPECQAPLWVPRWTRSSRERAPLPVPEVPTRSIRVTLSREEIEYLSTDLVPAER